MKVAWCYQVVKVCCFSIISCLMSCLMKPESLIRRRWIGRALLLIIFRDLQSAPLINIKIHNLYYIISFDKGLHFSSLLSRYNSFFDFLFTFTILLLCLYCWKPFFRLISFLSFYYRIKRYSASLSSILYQLLFVFQFF